MAQISQPQSHDVDYDAVRLPLVTFSPSPGDVERFLLPWFARAIAAAAAAAGEWVVHTYAPFCALSRGRFHEPNLGASDFSFMQPTRV